MDISKLNYPAINEEFCYWYFKINGKFPKGECNYSKQNLIRYIKRFKKEFNQINRSQLK